MNRTEDDTTARMKEEARWLAEMDAWRRLLDGLDIRQLFTTQLIATQLSTNAVRNVVTDDGPVKVMDDEEGHDGRG